MYSRLLKFVLLVCLLAGAPSALCQPLPERYPLVGKVLDQFGTPLPGATITLRRQDSNGQFAYWGGFASTDSAGRFKFPEAEEGRYFINADLGGYGQLANHNVLWQLQQPPLDLVMQKLASVPVKILGQDGAPLASSRVLLRLRGEATPPVRTGVFQTSPEGIATVPMVYPATYSLFVAAEGKGFGFNEVKVQYSATPPVPEVRLQSGGDVQIAVGEAANPGAPSVRLGGASLVLNAEPGIAAFAGSEAVPAAGENVATLGVAGDRAGIVSTDGNGLIKLRDVPPGKYKARAYLPGHTPQESEIVVEAGKGLITTILFPSKPAARVTFELKGRDDQPLADREWTVRVMGLAGSTEEPPAPGAPVIQGPAGRRATSDSAGKFSLYPLKPGKYRFYVALRKEGGADGPAVNVQGEATLAGGSIAVKYPGLP